MNINPVSFRIANNNLQIQQKENHTQPSFRGPKDKGLKGLAILAAMGTTASAAHLGSVSIKDIQAEKEAQELDKRKEVVLEKLKSLRRDYNNPDKPYLWSNTLERECYYPAYTKERFVKDGFGKHVDYSILTPESLDIIEKVTDNEAFAKNQNLLHAVLDSIINGFVARKNIYSGINFKYENRERARKIDLIMDAYLLTPDAQNNEYMQKNIGYIMARAADAPTRAVTVTTIDIMKPADKNKTYTKEEVDNLVYRLDYSQKVFRENLQPAELEERLENVRRELDKNDEYKRNKTCYSINSFMAGKWEINSINLPVFEKYFAHKEFTENPGWQHKIAYISSDINSNIDYCNEKTATEKTEKILKLMDDFLADKEAQADEKAAKKYFDELDDITAW